MATTVPLSRRQQLTSVPVTLDGKPARISGYNLPYAHVRNADTMVEFAWETADRIVTSKDGAFRS